MRIRTSGIGQTIQRRVAGRSRNSLRPPLLLAILALAWLSTITDGQQPLPPSRVIPDNFPLEILNPTATHPCVHSSVFRRTYQGIRGSFSIYRTTSERDAEGSEWESETREFSLSFVTTAVASRNGGDDLFVAGLKGDGSAIVERWLFEPRVGDHYVKYPGELVPAIGMPLGTYTPTVLVVESGSSSGGPPPVILPPPEPQRSTLYEGFAGPFTAMAADPEGRFLLLYDFEAKDIIRFRFDQTPAVMETLYRDEVHSSLRQIANMNVRDFGTEGRKILMRRMHGDAYRLSDEVYTILHDSTNDGIFDSLTSYDHATFMTTPYSTWEAWVTFWKLEE